MAKRNKKRDIYEVSIKLLPEKAKRDYLLRMVSFIIILIFIIINFLIVFLPRISLLAEVNNLTRGIYKLESEYRNLQENESMIDKKLYNIGKNNDVLKIESNMIDYLAIMNKITDENKHYYESYIENVKYKSDKNNYTIEVSVLFVNIDDPYTFHSNIKQDSYFSTVEMKSIVQDVPVKEGVARKRAFYTFVINTNTAPKVGDIDVE